MKGVPSKKTSVVFGLIFIVLLIAAGFFSGVAGLNGAKAFLVMAGVLLLVGLPVLVSVVRASMDWKRQR